MFHPPNWMDHRAFEGYPSFANGICQCLKWRGRGAPRGYTRLAIIVPTKTKDEHKVVDERIEDEDDLRPWLALCRDVLIPTYKDMARRICHCHCS